MAILGGFNYHAVFILCDWNKLSSFKMNLLEMSFNAAGLCDPHNESKFHLIERGALGVATGDKYMLISRRRLFIMIIISTLQLIWQHYLHVVPFRTPVCQWVWGKQKENVYFVGINTSTHCTGLLITHVNLKAIDKHFNIHYCLLVDVSNAWILQFDINCV